MEDAVTLTIVILIGIFGTFFNVFTITIIFADRKLRRRPSNNPIISFLLSSGIQGCIAAPVYIYRKLAHKHDRSAWVCDLYRVPYFTCGHIMKLSLLIVCIDRLIAVRWPFIYHQLVTRRKMTIILFILWFITILIDMIPFIKPGNYEDGCRYRPTHAWGFSVIIIYNIIPLAVIIISYSLIWYTAAKFAYKDRAILHKSLKIKKSTTHVNNNTDITSVANINESSNNIVHPKEEYQQEIPLKSLKLTNGINESTVTELDCKNDVIIKNVVDESDVQNKSVDKTQDISYSCLITDVNYINEVTIVYNQPPDPDITAKTVQINTTTNVVSALDNDGVDKMKQKRKISISAKLFKNVQFGLEMKATKVSLTLIITYIICWGPLGIFYMIDHFCDFCYSNKDELSDLRTAIKILAFTSSFLAPTVYCWLNTEYRKAAVKLIKQFKN